MLEGRTLVSNLAWAYMDAKEDVLAQGFAHEIDWQGARSLTSVSEPEFLRESAWVVLSCGMREQVIRCLFPRIESAFLFWKSAQLISERARECRDAALTVLNHEGKIDALVGIAVLTASQGFDEVHHRLATEGVAFIRTLPYMGKVTSYHLAKNLGMAVAKPDRHLSRIAAALGWDSPIAMCKAISDAVGDSVAVVDLVLWRFANTRPDYINRLYASSAVGLSGCADQVPSRARAA